jgi:hypothetical protein
MMEQQENGITSSTRETTENNQTHQDATVVSSMTSGSLRNGRWEGKKFPRSK